MEVKFSQVKSYFKSSEGWEMLKLQTFIKDAEGNIWNAVCLNDGAPCSLADDDVVTIAI